MSPETLDPQTAGLEFQDGLREFNATLRRQLESASRIEDRTKMLQAVQVLGNIASQLMELEAIHSPSAPGEVIDLTDTVTNGHKARPPLPIKPLEISAVEAAVPAATKTTNHNGENLGRITTWPTDPEELKALLIRFPGFTEKQKEMLLLLADNIGEKVPVSALAECIKSSPDQHAVRYFVKKLRHHPILSRYLQEDGKLRDHKIWFELPNTVPVQEKTGQDLLGDQQPNAEIRGSKDKSELKKFTERDKKMLGLMLANPSVKLAPAQFMELINDGEISTNTLRQAFHQFTRRLAHHAVLGQYLRNEGHAHARRYWLELPADLLTKYASDRGIEIPDFLALR